MKHPIKTTFWRIEYFNQNGLLCKDRIESGLGLLTITEAKYCIEQALPQGYKLLSIKKSWGYVENPLLE